MAWVTREREKLEEITLLPCLALARSGSPGWVAGFSLVCLVFNTVNVLRGPAGIPRWAFARGPAVEDEKRIPLSRSVVEDVESRTEKKEKSVFNLVQWRECREKNHGKTNVRS